MKGSNTGQVTEFPGRVTREHSVIIQRTFCPFLIRYIFVLSVIHPLHLRLLTPLCPLLVRYICAPYMYNFRDDFHHRINNSCIFSVRLASVTFIRCYVTAPLETTGARIYENLLPCLMLRGILFNSIQKFRENNSQ